MLHYMFAICANKFHPTLVSNSYIPLLPQALIASKEELSSMKAKAPLHPKSSFK